MLHNNISIFIPHIGCPNQCSFCNQKSITGITTAPTPEEVTEICVNAFNQINDKSNTEIAFFGGSFTAIDRNYMISLLECVQQFIGIDRFKGVRISTRPDCIDFKILQLLKKYNVTSIELGTQSMFDEVLEANDRGHTVNNIKNAARLIKEFDFELGMQMMVGLYKSTPELDLSTAEEIIKLKPDTVRIYPIVILKDTKLAGLFSSGDYEIYSLEQAISICSSLIEMFEDSYVKIIKLGLHASEFIEKDMVGGIYHPAFKELCYNSIYYNRIIEKIKDLPSKCLSIEVPAKSMSKVIGQKRRNILELNKLGYKVKLIPSDTLKEFEINIFEEGNACT